MSKVTVQSPTYTNRQTKIGEAGHVLVTDETGTAEVSTELASLLLCEKYVFMGFQKVNDNDIKKIEEDDLSKTEQGEDIKQPKTEEKTPAEIIEKEEAQDPVNDDEIKTIIEAATDIKELREIAITLELNSIEWEGYKRHNYFKKYLLEKIRS